MPRLPVDYSNTCFYKIVCKDLNITDIYVRHTTDFTKRKYNHKHICSESNHKDHDLYVYRFIRENGGWENFDMVLLDRHTCNG
jgi:hypothetical protein